MPDKQSEPSPEPEQKIRELTEGKASARLSVPDGALPSAWSDVLPPADAPGGATQTGDSVVSAAPASDTSAQAGGSATPEPTEPKQAE